MDFYIYNGYHIDDNSERTQRDPEMKNIKIYGDSILKGVMYNESLGRYKLCSYRFDDIEENGIAIENNCKMGATVDKGFEIIKDTLDDCDKDTVVVLEYGGNDCNFDWSAVSAEPDRTDFLPATPAERFVKTYREMIEYCRSKGATVVVSSLVPIESGRFMNFVSKGLSYDNILKWLGDVNTISRWQEYYSSLVEKLARSMNCPLLDLRSEFLLPHRLDNMICVDGIHPNADGHSLIREIFMRSFADASIPV